MAPAKWFRPDRYGPYGFTLGMFFFYPIVMVDLGIRNRILFLSTLPKEGEDGETTYK